MPSQVHRIRRQRWMVRAHSTIRAFQLRKCLRDDWRERLLPVFEQAFDRVTSEGKTIRIPRLELRLKVAREDKLIELLPELIQQQLTEELSDTLRGLPQWSSKRTEYKTAETPTSQLDILFNYLCTGLMPWETSHRTAAELAFELKQTCSEQQSKVVDFVRQEQVSAPFCFRLLQLLSRVEAESIGRNLLEGISPSWKSGALDLFGLLFCSKTGPLARGVELQLETLLLSESLAAKQSELAPDFVALAERQLAPPHCEALRQLIAMLPPASASLLRGTKPHDFARPSIQSVSQIADSAFDVEKLAIIESPIASTAAGEFPLTVSYAGLILLHPFLARFFRATA